MRSISVLLAFPGYTSRICYTAFNKYNIWRQKGNTQSMPCNQCSGSVTFWYGSGNLVLYSGLRIQDRALFDGGFFQFFCLFLTVGTVPVHKHQSSNITCHLEVTKQLKSWFTLIFCLLVEGFGSVQIIPDPDPRPQKRILWIWIWNTA